MMRMIQPSDAERLKAAWKALFRKRGAPTYTPSLFRPTGFPGALLETQHGPVSCTRPILINRCACGGMQVIPLGPEPKQFRRLRAERRR